MTLMGMSWILFEIALNGFDKGYVMSLSTDKENWKSWVKRNHIIIFWIAMVAVFSGINFSTDFSLISAFLFPILSILYPIIFNAKNILKQSLHILFLYFTVLLISV